MSPKLLKVFHIFEVLIISMALIFVLLVGAINLPLVHTIITRKTNTILEKKDIPLHIGKVSLLLNGKIGITDIEIITGTDTIIFAGLASFNVRPLPLFTKKVVISKVNLSNIVANIIASEKTGELNIISVFSTGNNSEKSETATESENKSSSWEISIKEMVFNNIRFRYDDKPGGILVEQYLRKAAVEFGFFSLLKKQIDIADLKLETPEGRVAVWDSKTDKPEDNSETPAWKISAKHLNINELNFIFEQPDIQQQIEVTLKEGELSLEKLDLGTSEILVSEIKLTTPVITFVPGHSVADELQTPETTNSFSLPFLPSTIKSEKISITDGSFFYKSADSLQAVALEKWLPVQALDATFKNTEMSPSGYNLNVSDLAFTIGNTFIINSGSFFFAADSLQQIKLNLNLTAELNEKQAWMAKKTEFSFITQIEGDTSALKIQKMSLQSSAGLHFKLAGKLTEPLKIMDAGVDVLFVSGSVSRNHLVPIVKNFSPKTVLPPFSTFTLSGYLKNKVMLPVFGLKISSQSAMADVNGKFDIALLSGEFQSAFSGVQLAQLFGKSLPENLTGNLKGKGKMKKGQLPEGEFSIQIDSVTYKEKTTKNISLNIKTIDNIADFELITTDNAAKIDIYGDVSIGKKNRYKGNVNGIFDVDIFGLNLYNEPLAIQGKMNTNFECSANEINTSAELTDFIISNKKDTASIAKTTLELSSNNDKIELNFDAGFLNATLNSQASMKDFNSAFRSTKPKNIINLDSANFLNLAEIQKLGNFKFEASLSHNKLFNLFYPDSVFNFSDINLTVSKTETDNITTGTFTTDWIVFNQLQFVQPGLELRIERGSLAFEGKIDSLVGPKVKLGQTGIKINILPSNINGNLYVSDKNNSILHQIGFEAEKEENLVIFKSPAPFWIINYNKWELEPTEFLIWNELDKTLTATLDLHFNENYIGLKGNNKGIIELNVKNIELANLEMPGIIDFVPDGIIDANVKYSKTEKNSIELDLLMRKMIWRDIHFDLLTAKGNLVADSTGILYSTINISADDLFRLNAGFMSNTVNKTYALKSDFHNLQFQLFEPFVNRYANNLHGTTNGEITLDGKSGKMALNGAIRFNDFGLKIISLETWLTIPDNKIDISNNEFIFNNFTVIDSLKRPLTVNGKIVFEDNKNILTDLSVKTDKIMAMNTTSSDNSSFYGSAVINSGLSIKGSVFSPEIKGNMELESGTNLTYKMIQDLSVEESQTDVVFAAITDSLTIIYPETDKKIKSTKMPLIETTISIDPKSIFNVKITDIYDVDITIGGEGLLNYNMLPNNTMSLNGTYEIKTGDCKLKITGWPRKNFTITPGSTLRWNGSVENPELSLEATSKVKGSYLNPIDNKNRVVDFIVSMQLKNQLSELEIVFDIQSNDQYITSVLSTLSDDEIMRQAVNLLLFETINLPGMESSGNYITSQINSFWETQLNALSSRTLKNTKLSFGIDSYNEAGTGGEQEKTSFTYEMEHKFMNNRATVKLSGKLNDYNEDAYQTNSIFENFIFEYALDSLNTKNLKLYQKRDYEDMLEGEVVKYGVGFLYRKNYKKLKDIWQSEKKQKLKKEKKQK